MARFIHTERDAHVGFITLDDPATLNALNAALLGELHEAVAAMDADEGLRAVVLRGGGEKSFVAGADIREFDGATPVDAIAIAGRIRRVTEIMTRSRKPYIASIQGFCLGGGLELALACDLRIAADKAMLGLPEIRLGIMPGGGGIARMVREVGVSATKLLALTGQPITAQRALDLGLLVSVHPAADLPEATAKLAQTVAGLGPFAMGQLKGAIRTAADTGLDSALQAEIDAFALCYATEDQKEGASAFLEKRKPKFTGR